MIASSHLNSSVWRTFARDVGRVSARLSPNPSWLPRRRSAGSRVPSFRSSMPPLRNTPLAFHRQRPAAVADHDSALGGFRKHDRAVRSSSGRMFLHVTARPEVKTAFLRAQVSTPRGSSRRAQRASPRQRRVRPAGWHSARQDQQLTCPRCRPTPRCRWRRTAHTWFLTTTQ